jgi:hypothetical protein
MVEEFSAPEVAAGPPLGTQTVYYRGPKWFDDIEKILLEEGKVGFWSFLEVAFKVQCICFFDFLIPIITASLD